VIRSSTSGGLRVKRDKLRGALVIAKLAISLTLLAGAGLLIRSFVRLVQSASGIRQGDKEPWLMIVGEVGVVKQYGVDIDTKMVTYFPYATWLNGEMFVTARTTGDPAALSNSMIWPTVSG
jgi:hypothetical protein